MYIVQVYIHVKPDDVDDFIEATVENARNSREEAGIARFDFIQQLDDPNRFMLIEVYRTPEDPAEHKKTQHYQAWRDKVENMMAEPRTSVKYVNVYPDESGWE